VKEKRKKRPEQPPFSLPFISPAPYLLIPLPGSIYKKIKNRIIPHWWFLTKELVYVYKCNITDPIKKESRRLMIERDGGKKKFFFWLPLEIVEGGGIERQGKKESTRNNTKRRASWRN